MTKRSPKPFDPTPPDDTLLDRQAWLNMGGDVEMDEEKERSIRRAVDLIPGRIDYPSIAVENLNP